MTALEDTFRPVLPAGGATEDRLDPPSGIHGPKLPNALRLLHRMRSTMCRERSTRVILQKGSKLFSSAASAEADALS